VRVVDLGGSNAKDPDELLKAQGPQALRERIAGSRHWVDFLLDGFWKLDPRPSPDRKADIVRRIEALLGSIPDTALRQQCAESAHPFLERLGILESQLRDRVPERIAQVPRAISRQPVREAPENGKLTGIRRVEAQFLFDVLSNPILVLDARNHVQPSDLTDPSCRAVWDLLVAQSELDDAPPDPRSLMANLNSTLAGFVTELFQLSEVKPDEITARRELDDFMRNLNRRRVRERRRQLAAEARISGTSEQVLTEYNLLLASENEPLSSRMDP
jgi:DNA primase